MMVFLSGRGVGPCCHAATADVTAAADLTAAPNCSTAVSPVAPARARPARMISTSLIPIQARSTNGGGAFVRSRTTTEAPGRAAFHWSMKSAVSFREVENSWRGLTSIASRVGIWGSYAVDCLVRHLGGVDDLKKR